MYPFIKREKRFLGPFTPSTATGSHIACSQLTASAELSVMSEQATQRSLSIRCALSKETLRNRGDEEQGKGPTSVHVEEEEE
ncbi:unnamed protein product [Lota lota]